MPPDPGKIKAIFLAAQETASEAERVAYLEEACAGDSALRQHVEALLQAHNQPDHLLDRPAVELFGGAPDKSPPSKPAGPDSPNVLDAAARRGAESSAWPTFPGHEIVGRLGAGGMGVVYKARDLLRDSLVALKTLTRCAAPELYRFKQEFRSLANLNHPHLIMLYQMLSEGEHWCFTMELIEGQDLFTALRPSISPDAPTIARPLAEPAASRSASTDDGVPFGDEDGVRDQLRQLCDGLVFLHSHEKLHCDLKPSNVMVERGGRVVILDFGLVRQAAHAPAEFMPPPTGKPSPMRDDDLFRTRESAISGTIGYMSPEQAAGGPLTPASDWYAVGVMLYQALTGRLPFLGGLDVLWRKQHEDPPPPAALAANVPPDLDKLCMELLHRDPAARPTGPQILTRLARRTGSELARDDPRLADPRVFVGRAAQFGVLWQAAADVMAGAARLLLIQGPSGAGKSTLLQRFLSEFAVSHDAMVLHGRCFEQESVPFKAVDALMDHLSQVLKRMPDVQVAESLPNGMGALTQMFPVLQRVPGIASASTPQSALEGPELRRQAFSALRELLRGLVRRRPVALWIDDLQWGDLDSAELLASLFHGPHSLPVLFLFSYRGEYVNTSPCLRALLRTLDQNPRVRRQDVLVDPLTQPEAVELARQLLGTAADTTEAMRIARESGGNPYFIHELVLNARVGSVSTGELDEVIWSRVCRLPEPARSLLAVVAVAGQPLQQAIAWQTSNVEGDEHRSMALLRAQHLVRGSGPGPEDEVDTFHDRIRESIRARLPRDVVRGHHRHLAERLEHVVGIEPERLANHYAEAGERVRAAGYYARAADQAAEALAFDHAARLYGEAADKGDWPVAEAAVLYGKRADALANAGRGPESAREYLRAADGAAAQRALELRRRAAYQFCTSGHTVEGHAVLARVLQSVGMSMPRSLGRAILAWKWYRFRLWLRGLKYRRRDAGQVPERDLHRIDVTWTVSAGLSMIEPACGAAFQANNLLLALRAGEPHRLARALAWEASMQTLTGLSGLRRGVQLQEMARSLAHRLDDRYALGMAQLAAGINDFRVGRLPSARGLLEQAGAIFQNCRGAIWERESAQLFLLRSLLMMGEFRELERLSGPLLKEARERGDLYFAIMNGAYVGANVLLAADDATGARGLVHELMSEWPSQEFNIQQLHALWGETCIDLYCEEGTAAWDRLTRAWPLTRGPQKSQAIRILMLSFHARSALAASRQLAGHAVAPLLAAAEGDAARLEDTKVPAAAALAQPIRASIASCRGNEAEARNRLRAAVDCLDAVAMHSYAAAARWRLGQLSGGDEGRRLVAQADAWMGSQAIRNPARMVALHVPGFQG